MTQQAADMAVMKLSAKRFGQQFCRVDNTRNVFQNNLTVGLPLLNCKVLNGNVARAGRRATGIDH